MIIVSVTAALLAFLLIGLSVRVIQLRRSHRIALGSAGDHALERAIRVQANFAEYAPLALVLLLLCALRGLHDALLALLCTALLIGRALHAYGVSQSDENFRYRTFGMMLTFAVLALAAISLLILALRGSV